MRCTMNTELYNLIELLDEYRELHVQISPKSIINTLKQMNVMYSPYGLKYDSESGRDMDIIILYDNGVRNEITLMNNYIVAIEIDTRLPDMTEMFLGQAKMSDLDLSSWRLF